MGRGEEGNKFLIVTTLLSMVVAIQAKCIELTTIKKLHLHLQSKSALKQRQIKINAEITLYMSAEPMKVPTSPSAKSN